MITAVAWSAVVPQRTPTPYHCRPTGDRVPRPALSNVVQAQQATAAGSRDNNRDRPLGRDQPAALRGGAGRAAPRARRVSRRGRQPRPKGRAGAAGVQYLASSEEPSAHLGRQGEADHWRHERYGHDADLTLAGTLERGAREVGREGDARPRQRVCQRHDGRRKAGKFSGCGGIVGPEPRRRVSRDGCARDPGVHRGGQSLAG